MNTFQYIEDYLEFIGGYRDINNRKLGLFDQTASPLSLARYDVQIVASLASQTSEKNTAYTDKQAELAKKIVNKYRKQLSQLPTPVAVPENFDKYRMTIRTIDRSKRAYVKDQKIHLRFPYDTELINSIKAQVKAGDGSGEFDFDNKIWKLAITESTVNWLCTVAEKYQIELDDEIKDLYQKILDCEKQQFVIELVDTGSGYDITNAADSLKLYIVEKCGGFDYDNLLALIDNSTVLGYTIPKDILLKFYNSNPKLTVMQRLLVIRNNKKFNKDRLTIEDIVNYARATNRLPVYVYATGLPKPNTDDIKYLRHESTDTEIKCFVSESSILVGTRKQSWLSQAEKIFYIE